jgi:hypothetical protein
MCAATPSSGVRHRFAMLSAIKCFADHFGYSVSMLWGVTKGVAFCRFEELFAPVPGVCVANVSPEQLNEVAGWAGQRKEVRIGDRAYRVFRPGDKPAESLFSWDLLASGALARLAAPSWHQVVALTAPAIRRHTRAYVAAHRLEARLGIRVRVEEGGISGKRKPRRVMRDLEETVRSLVRIPWYTKTFIATDAEYIQQTLASHFKDAKFLPKKFDLQEATGRYVHRQDKHAMFTFLQEVDCLCRCSRIINIGGFLNDRSVKGKIIHEPYREPALMYVERR